jgi:hypothetical protein
MTDDQLHHVRGHDPISAEGPSLSPTITIFRAATTSDLRLHAAHRPTGGPGRWSHRLGLRAGRGAAPVHGPRRHHRPRWEDRRPLCLSKLAAGLRRIRATHAISRRACPGDRASGSRSRPAGEVSQRRFPWCHPLSRSMTERLGSGRPAWMPKAEAPVLPADLVRDVACARYILLKRGRHASGWVDSAGWL